ncbi:MAG TPA: ATP synthase F1 subunit delta [Burkholderiaceae bacterium]|nr:ATP synthase F1 subunit delta [Burkholderiaceae bacterium]
MSQRTSATRYAKALLEVAIAESDPSTIERDLATLSDAMQGHADLRRALTSPGVPQSGRENVARAVAAQAGVQPPVAKLFALLAERGRLDLVPTILEVYRERLLAHANVVRALVTSAAPLPADRIEALMTALARVTGKKVRLDTRVEPSLIGGVVTQIGSTVYDGSISTQLARMRQQLVENA